MPELPEVETVVRQLRRDLPGRRLLDVDVLDSKLAAANLAPLVGRTVGELRRVGKRIALRCCAGGAPAGADPWLAVHLRMTGRLVWRDEANIPPDGKHLRVHFHMTGGDLLFYDARRFGTLEIIGMTEVEAREPLDPMSRAFTAKRLVALAGGCSQAAKPWLLRQDRLVGIGNIYASEILHESGIHPDRPMHTLTGAEFVRLHAATRAVLARAIRHCGTTFSDFQDSRGEIGRYQNYLKVYGRAGEPCRTCDARVERDVQGGRATYWCPACQPRRREVDPS